VTSIKSLSIGSLDGSVHDEATSSANAGASQMQDDSGLTSRRSYDGKRWPTVNGELPPHLAHRPRTELNLPPPTEATQRRFDQMSAERRTETQAMQDAANDAPPLSAADQQLAAYLLARQADRRPADAQLLGMLKRGNESMAQARRLLPLGRGNVRPDCQATGYAGWRTTTASRDVMRAREKAGERLTHAEQAGVIAHVGTGNCGEHAQLTAHLHVARLRRGEIVSQVDHRWRDHSWTLYTGEEGRKVMLDSWKDGPAVDACDAVYGVHGGKKRYNLWHSNLITVSREFDEGLRRYGPAMATEVAQAKCKRDAKNDKPGLLQMWDAKPVVEKAFADRARKALDAVPDAKRFMPGTPEAGAQFKQQRATLLNEIRAVEAARSLGASVHDAAASAPEVVDGAKNLRRPVPRVAPEEPQ